MTVIPLPAPEPPTTQEPPTDEQLLRVAQLARSYKARRWTCERGGPVTGLGAEWLYVVLEPERGGPVHLGIAPDGSSHS